MTKKISIPFHDLLGIRLKRVHPDGVTIEMEIRDEMRNGHGGLHGGVTATIIDAAVGSAVMHHFDGKRSATTVEMKLNYFLPLQNGRVRARAKLLRVGTSLAIGSVEVKNAKNQLAAFGVATYKIL